MTLFKISTIYGAWDVDVEKEIITSEPPKPPVDVPESPQNGNGRSKGNIDVDDQFTIKKH